MAKELHELNELEERVILVAVEMDERSSRSAMDTDACLDELEELVKQQEGRRWRALCRKGKGFTPDITLAQGKLRS